jgi:hypothetical protein
MAFLLRVNCRKAQPAAPLELLEGGEDLDVCEFGFGEVVGRSRSNELSGPQFCPSGLLIEGERERPQETEDA